MVNENYSAEAIAAMATVVASLESRIAQLNEQINEEKIKRAQFLHTEVSRLLPDFSSKTFNLLRSRLKAFVDDVVIRAFGDNRKILFLFKPSGYDNALSAIQTRLAHYLDTLRVKPLPQIDEAITRLAAQMAELDARYLSTVDIIRMLKRADEKKIAMPNDVTDYLDTIAQRSRKPAFATTHTHWTHTGSSSSSQHYQQHDTVASNNTVNTDSDLWMYYFSGIPTSFRTVVADRLIENNEGAFVSAMDGSAAQNGTAWQGQGSSEIDFGDAANVAESGADIDFDDDANSRAAIATDDRLGAFS